MGAGDEILKALARIEGKLDAVLGVARAVSSPGGHDVAPDSDLDGQYGDPQVKFSPKRWTGDNYKGSSFSACPPDFLDALAEALQWSSEHPKAGKEKYAAYDARDASRARGWAKRIRAGWQAPGTQAALPEPDLDVPF